MTADDGLYVEVVVVLVPVPPAAAVLANKFFSNSISATMASYSSFVGSAAISVARLSTVGGVPGMVGGSSKGGRGLGGSSGIGVAKRSCHMSK